MKTKAEARAKTETPATIRIDAGKRFESASWGGTQPASGKGRGRGWLFLLLSAAILLWVLWWHWNRGWEEIESGLHGSETTNVPKVQEHVPAGVMEKLVTHRVDPDYPAAARPAKLQGVIVLDVVVGSDGSVLDMHALNGPEILAQSAMDAMRWWRFDPYRLDGQPVVVETTVAVEFKP